jgi:hypothetical protein
MDARAPLFLLTEYWYSTSAFGTGCGAGFGDEGVEFGLDEGEEAVAEKGSVLLRRPLGDDEELKEARPCSTRANQLLERGGGADEEVTAGSAPWLSDPPPVPNDTDRWIGS